MRVLFLSSYAPVTASTRYRVTQYLPYFKRMNIQCTLSTLMGTDFFDRFYEPGRWLYKLSYLTAGSLLQFRSVWRAREFDLVFVQREVLLFGPPLIELLLPVVSRRPMIFDFDDAIFLLSSYVNPAYGRLGTWLKWPSKVKAILRWSRHVIACNNFTARFALEHNRHVTVVPTVVDAEQFRPAPHPDRAVPVIGYLGNRGSARYLRMLVPVFEELARRYRFVVKIVGAEEPFTARGVQVEELPFDRAREVADFQDMDIGVYPLVDEPWAWGKPGLKLVQYMAVGIPVVASPVGGNLEILREGECGFFARTEAEWVDRLARLLEDRALRRRMGEQGRKLVEERYCVQVQIRVLADIFDRVSRSRG